MIKQGTNMNLEVVAERRKVIMFAIVGSVIGLCVGYTLAKFAYWLMNLHYNKETVQGVQFTVHTISNQNGCI